MNERQAHATQTPSAKHFPFHWHAEKIFSQIHTILQLYKAAAIFSDPSYQPAGQDDCLYQTSV